MNAQTDIAVASRAQEAGIDLARVDLKDVALAQFGQWKEQVDAASKHFSTLVVEMPTQAKVDEYKSMRQRMINTPLATARATSKALKSKLATVSKDVGAELAAIEFAWGKVDKLISPQIDARQAELDEERTRKAQGEAFRKGLHLALIERIKGYVEQATGLPSERIALGVTFVQGLSFGDECQEFLQQYRAAQASALASLIAMRDEAKAREDAEALRIENERIAAELEAQRADLARQAAELREQQVARTHSFVFAFPESEPETAISPKADSPSSVTCTAEAQPPQQALKAEPATVPAEATVRGMAANEIPRGGAMGAEQATAVAIDGEPATLKVGDICARLGFTLTAAFISDVLGIESSGQEKRAVLFKESDFVRICDALVRHVNSAKAGELLAA